MLIADKNYSEILRTLVDLYDQIAPFADPKGRRAWIENQIQQVFCAGDLYPASSADCDPDHPSIVMFGEEPSAELVAEVESMLAGMTSAILH
jgi:hypothetical protein